SDITQEETACAIALDQMDEVEYWVRNLERRGAASFSLPTSTDAFYPDFVAFLRDGRVLVVEYKGWAYFTNEDSREKRDIGSVWATASKGRCRVVMVTAPSAVGTRTIEQQLRDAIACACGKHSRPRTSGSQWSLPCMLEASTAREALHRTSALSPLSTKSERKLPRQPDSSEVELLAL